MGYMNEFPHTRTFDSDLREIIDLIKKLSIEYTKDKTVIKNVVDYGAQGNGYDDTEAIQKAINALNPGELLYFPNINAGYKFGTITLIKPDIKIIGDATLHGNFIVNMQTQQYANITFAGLTFDNPNFGICVQRGTAINVTECTFKNNNKAILVDTIEAPVEAGYHIVEDLRVDSCLFWMVNYALYSSVDNLVAAVDTFIPFGDLTFINNKIKVAKITHISLARLDGGIITNNTMYHYGAAGKVKTKRNCIEVRAWSTGIVISNNSLFEAGLAAIYMYNSTGFRITGNHIIQSGQASIASAIQILNSSYLFGRGVIADNNIYAFSAYGVHLLNMDNISVYNNNIYNTADYSYYGEESIESITHYAVKVDATDGVIINVVAVGNVCLYPDIAYSGVKTTPLEVPNVATLHTADGIENYDVVNFSSINVINITNITPRYKGQRLVIVSYGTNVTVNVTGNITLADGVAYNLPSHSSLELVYNGNKWIELSRTKLQ